MLREPKFLCLCFQTLFNPLLTILMWLFLIIWKQPWLLRIQLPHGKQTDQTLITLSKTRSSQHSYHWDAKWQGRCSEHLAPHVAKADKYADIPINIYIYVITSLVITNICLSIYYIHISLSLSLSLGLIMARHLTITSVTSPISNKLTSEWLALHLGALPS